MPCLLKPPCGLDLVLRDCFLTNCWKWCFAATIHAYGNTNKKAMGTWSPQWKMEAANGWESSPTCIGPISVKCQRAELCGFMFYSDFSLLRMRNQKWHLLGKVEVSTKLCYNIKKRYNPLKTKGIMKNTSDLFHNCVSAHAFNYIRIMWYVSVLHQLE